ncbi:MAG TPA: Trk system potassium transporter TrkA [Flavobacteriaceae bacterium]|nr:Trk system potassium transporter TrkA [Flavobacteriaceae bacterium]
MKIIIAGAGEVGFHLAKLLSFESQDITLIDPDKNILAQANDSLDIRALLGDATSVSVLRDADVEKTDLVVAVTSGEAVNITVCLLAKKLGAKRTIARISNIEFIQESETLNFEELGIDDLISPETLASSEIELLLSQSAFNDTFEFENGELTMIGLTLSSSSAFVGRSVKEVAQIYPTLKYVPIALQRFGTQYTIIPRGDTKFEKDDQVYFTTDRNGVEQIVEMSGKEMRAVKNVMILGGSKIGVRTAKELCERGYRLKLVERNREKAFEIADEIPDCLVIHGDGRNTALLEEENIEEMDAFISVTGDSETNIMSSLMAKSKGVQKAIALVENMDYFQLSHSIGIDSLINKKLLAANTIFRYVRRGKVVAMTKLANMNAELLEFMVTPHARVVNKLIRDLNFPDGAIIGGVIRDGKGIIALGDFRIREGDRMVICCLPRALDRVGKLFN